MTEAELLARIAAGEGPLCEFKEGGNSSTEIREAVVGFANTVRSPDVAVLFLGLKADGAPSGKIANADETQRSVEGWLKKCYPKIEGIRPHVLIVEGQPVVAIEVPESTNGPHFTGPAFKRVGSETREASPEMFEEMITDRIEPARVLRAFLGKTVHYQRERVIGSGHHRAWNENVGSGTLARIDALGLGIGVGGEQHIDASWKQVNVVSRGPGQAPLIRVALD
jgi:hypothetical protein